MQASAFSYWLKMQLAKIKIIKVFCMWNKKKKNYLNYQSRVFIRQIK